MSVITRAHHPKAMWPGVKRWYGVEYAAIEPIWPRIFESQDSTMAYEEDVEEYGFGTLREMEENQALSYDTTQQGPVTRYLHIMWGLGWQVTLPEMQDNQYEKLALRRTSRLARSTRETEEQIHAAIFNRAFNSSYVGGDAVEMISTAHPTPSGNQSNELTIAADLSEASIEDLVIQIMDTRDARGLRIPNNPMQLIIPNAYHFEANRIVKSVLQNDTSNNAVNVLKMLNTFPKGILTNRYLLDTDAWFIQTDMPEGLTHYTRMPWTFDKDNDFETKNAKASVIGRLSCGWSNWRNIYGSEGA